MDIDTALETALGEPAKASADGTTVEQHKLSDLVDAYKAKKSLEAGAARRAGIRFIRLNPPGMT